MKKYIVMLLVTIMLMFTIGCMSEKMNTEKFKMNTMCIDGVTYIYFKEVGYSMAWGYMSVKLDTNSKVVPCEVTE